MMMESQDDKHEIQIDLLSKAQNEYSFENKLARALEYIKAGAPIKGFAELLSDELWLREILKDLDAKPCHVCANRVSAARSKAIQLLGEHLGLIGNKSKKKSKKEVTFEE